MEVTITVTPPNTDAGNFDIYQYVYDIFGNQQPTPILVQAGVSVTTLIAGYTIILDDAAYGVQLVNLGDRGLDCSGSTMSHYFINTTPLPSSPITTIVPTPSVSPLISGDYGLLYNFYTITGGTLLPAGWHVPTIAEWDTLRIYVDITKAGGELKEVGTSHWTPPNVGATDNYGFRGLPGGLREVPISLTDFVYLHDQGYWWASTDNGGGYAYKIHFEYGNDDSWSGSRPYTSGLSIRGMKDSTILTSGQTSTMTDIDGNVYTTVCIGTQEWMTSNLKVKHYNNGTPIPEVTLYSTWSGLTTGAYCVYNNGLPNPSTTPGISVTRTPSTTPTLTPTSTPGSSTIPTPTPTPSPALQSVYFYYAFGTPTPMNFSNLIPEAGACVAKTYWLVEYFWSYPAFVFSTDVGQYVNYNGGTIPDGWYIISDNYVPIIVHVVGGYITLNPYLCASPTPSTSITVSPSSTPPFVSWSVTPSITPTPTISPYPPTVLTTVATNIRSTSATSGGNVTYPGDSVAVQRGLVWSAVGTPTYDVYDGRTRTTAGTGSFVDTMTGLSPNTTYNYRAFSRNSTGGVGYGAMYQLTTLPAQTVMITNTNGANAISNVTVNGDAVIGTTFPVPPGMQVAGLTEQIGTNMTIVVTLTNPSTGEHIEVSPNCSATYGTNNLSFGGINTSGGVMITYGAGLC